jgi:glucokinase
VLQRLYDTIKHVMPSPPDSMAGIGVALPGPVDIASGTLLKTPNLPLENVPMTRLIEEAVGGPVFIANDADLAGLAEHQMGAGRGSRSMIYITVSTGIGGGLILDGKPFSGRGQGGEIGHMVVLPGGPECGCGKRGHLESTSSGTGIARAAREALENNIPSMMLEMVNNDLSNITAKIVGKAAERGDSLAKKVIADAGHYLGIGIASLMVLLNPDMFVIGGGVSKLGDILFDPMHKAIQENAMHRRYWENIPIVRAQLGDDVCLIGAAALVKIMKGL